MNIWHSSDHHFDHDNIRKYCERSFQSAGEMNEMLIQYWNELVRPDDWVYYHGDLSLSKDTEKVMSWRRRMNGIWKLFIAGNHDNGTFLNDPELAETIIIGNKDRRRRQGNSVAYYDNTICLSHYPVKTPLVNLHGHTHSKVTTTGSYPLQIHIGIDSWNYRPAPWEEIKKLLEKE